jgi:HSP20 family protein
MVESTQLPIKGPHTAGIPVSNGDWPTFDTLRHEIDRIFESFHRGFSPFRLGMPIPRETGWMTSPAVDFIETDQKYEISAELPGVEQKDIELKLTNGSLVIQGEKKFEKERQEKGYSFSERRYGSFTRTFPLPEGVDTGKIDAVFSNGVLKVTLPKTAAAQKSEKIAIKAA